MGLIRLTAKRQATLPKQLCDEMKVGPGDSLLVEKSTVDGQTVWCLRPVQSQPPDWFGGLRKYARGKPHDMESIRESIRRGRA